MSKFIVLFLVLLNWGRESYATILPGARAKTGQFPWLIQFQTIAPCGGILLSPDWVLTAAQCVQYKRNSITLFAAGLNGTGSSQTMGIKATYIFPQYQAYSTQHDHEHNIALIKLVQPFDMCDDKVQLLELAPVRLNDDYKTCLIFGWQSYVAPSTKVLAKPIQYNRVLLNTWKLCSYMLRGNTTYNNVFCTLIESEDGIKACAGNPGSPVICQDQYQRMIILGIASWSNFSLDCSGLPTYLGVSAFRTWIYDLIFNDRKNEDWDTDAISKGICGRDRYLGSIVSATSIWNYSDLVGSEYQQPTDGRIINVQEEAKKIEELQQRENRHRINDYRGISSRYEVPFDVLRERDDNLKQYNEIGQNRKVLDRIDKLIIPFPTRKSKSDHLGIEKHNKEFEKIGKIGVDDESDNSDFVVPIDEDYFIGRSHSLHFGSNERIFLRIIALAFLLNNIFMIF